MQINKEYIKFQKINYENLDNFFDFIKEENFKSLFSRKDFDHYKNLFNIDDLGLFLLFDDKIVGVWLMLKKKIFNQENINLSTWVVRKEYRSLYFMFFDHIKNINFLNIYNTSMNPKLMKIHQLYGFKKFDCNEIYFLPKKINFSLKKNFKIFDLKNHYKILSKETSKIIENVHKIESLNILLIENDFGKSVIIFKVKKFKRLIKFIEIYYLSNPIFFSKFALSFYKFCLLKYNSFFFKTHSFIYDYEKILIKKKSKTIMYKSNDSNFFPDLIYSELILFNK